MANSTISTVGIVNGQIVYAEHVLGIIQALDGTISNKIIITGDVIQGNASNTTNDENSFAQGDGTTASGNFSHAEGVNTNALGDYSHAEGAGTTAYQNGSHAEGVNTVTSGIGSHAEGLGTIAGGDYAHAEGESTTANGVGSHAEGLGTIASKDYQTVVGQYNKDSNTEDYFVVGVGDFSTKLDGLGINSTRTYISNSLYLPNLTNTAQTNLVTFDPADGKLYFISSSTIVIDTSSWSHTTNAGGPNYAIQFNSASILSGSENLIFSSSNLILTGSEQILIQGSNAGLEIFNTASFYTTLENIPYLVPAQDRYVTTIYVPSSSTNTFGQIWNLTYGPSPTHIYDITSSKGDLKFRGRIGGNSLTAVGRLGGTGMYSSTLNRVLAPDGGFSGTKVSKMLAYNPNTIGSQTLGFTASLDSAFEVSLIDYSCSLKLSGSGYGFSGLLFFESNNPFIYTPSNTTNYFTVFGPISNSIGCSNDVFSFGTQLSSSILALSASNSNISGSGKYLPVGFFMSTFDSNTPSNEQLINLTPSLTASFGIPEGKLFSGSFVGSTLTSNYAYSYLGDYNNNLKRIYCLVNLINNNNKIGIIEIDNSTTPTIVDVNTGSIGGSFIGSVPHISYNSTNTDVIINDVGTLRIFDASSTVNWTSPIYSITIPTFTYAQILPISNSFYCFGSTGTSPTTSYNIYKITSGSGGYTTTSQSFANSYFNVSTTNNVSSPAFASSINKIINFDRSDIVPNGYGSIGTVENPPTTYARTGFSYTIDTSSLTTSSYFNPYGYSLINGPNNIAEFKQLNGTLLSYIDADGVFHGTASYVSLSTGSKSGYLSPSSFGGSPLTASVLFSGSYVSKNYSISVIGEDSRIWNIENKTSSSFNINSNSSVALTGEVYWFTNLYNS